MVPGGRRRGPAALAAAAIALMQVSPAHMILGGVLYWARGCRRVAPWRWRRPLL